jgi:hypothetical protein
LEHLPYENFENILQQFNSVADNVVLSLPYSSTYLKVDFKIPRIKEHRIIINIHNAHKIFKPNEEHFWEIGYQGYSKKKIRRSITRFFEIKKQFTAKHNHSHLFFTLQSL